MLIQFDHIEEQLLPNFKGGEGTVAMRTFVDDNARIMKLRVLPGSSVGLHTHTGNSEIVFVLSGKATAVYNGVEEQLVPGCAHYCPEGQAHTIINNGTEDLVLYAVVPKVTAE